MQFSYSKIRRISTKYISFKRSGIKYEWSYKSIGTLADLSEKVKFPWWKNAIRWNEAPKRYIIAEIHISLAYNGIEQRTTTTQWALKVCDLITN